MFLHYQSECNFESVFKKITWPRCEIVAMQRAESLPEDCSRFESKLTFLSAQTLLCWLFIQYCYCLLKHPPSSLPLFDNDWWDGEYLDDDFGWPSSKPPPPYEQKSAEESGRYKFSKFVVLCRIYGLIFLFLCHSCMAHNLLFAYLFLKLWMVQWIGMSQRWFFMLWFIRIPIFLFALFEN